MKTIDGVFIDKTEPFFEANGKILRRVFESLPGTGLVVCTYTRGTTSGNHFHKGLIPSKKPERLYVVYGIVRLSAENTRGDKIEALVDEDTRIEIRKGVFHKFEMMTNVKILEYRICNEDPMTDTFDYSTFEEYCLQNLEDAFQNF